MTDPARRGDGPGTDLLSGERAWRSFVKINLALHVGAIRPDGYHPVDTACVFADGGDRLTFRAASGGSGRLVLEGPYAEALGRAPADGNLVHRARQILEAASGEALPPVDVTLHKAVPPASGLGGGTANGVTAMAALNGLLARPLSEEALTRRAIDLGADGPVMMAGYLGTRTGGGALLLRALGIGEAVSDGPSLPPLAVVIANPGKPVSTGAVFRAFDAAPPPQPFSMPLLLGALTLPQLQDFLAVSRNDLAPFARRAVPEIAALEEALAGKPGCLGARMSGSGASVFGLFTDLGAATRAAAQLGGRAPFARAAPLRERGAAA